MSNYKIVVKNEDINEVNNTLKLAQKYHNQFKILKAYKLYKYLYRRFGIKEIIPEMVQLASISNKQFLLKNKALKFKLINNLIEFGIKKNDLKNIKKKLIALKLNLLRNFFKYSIYEEYYNDIGKSFRNDPHIKFDFFHFLLEKEEYLKAEIEFKKLLINYGDIISNDKFFLGLPNFVIDLDQCYQINKSQINLNKFFDVEQIEKKNDSHFSFIIATTGNYQIFKEEILLLINSLKLTCKNFLLSIVIHDANFEQQNEIINDLNLSKLENYEIQFENIKHLGLEANEIKTFYTTRRFILSNQLINEYQKPIFAVDADTIVLKDLHLFIEANLDVDMSLTIKNINRTFRNSISAGYSLFLPTENSLLFLNFYTKILNETINKKKLIWFTDQILLYSTYIFMKRTSNLKTRSNSDNYYGNKNSYFYHTLHNQIRI